MMKTLVVLVLLIFVDVCLGSGISNWQQPAHKNAAALTIDHAASNSFESIEHERGQSSTKMNEIVGPLLGKVGSTEANFLFRPGNTEQSLNIIVVDGNGNEVSSVQSWSRKENDYVAKFHVDKLLPETNYQYAITDSYGKPLISSDRDCSFRTIPKTRKNNFRVAFISCVDNETRPVWKEIDSLGVDMLCLNGDTPYIDSTNLNVARSKHRSLLQTTELATLVAHTSTLGNWDDHDFGMNNGNGHSFAKHKHVTLKAFKEFRANGKFGNSKGEGVYHKSDHGVIEIFHLDPRYFSQTGPSPVDPTKPTCFGTDQWSWLLQSLKNSKATFKVLSMGAIWQHKKNTETDDMFTYWYERDALFDFVEAEKISGVILVGGDIHLSRHLIHPQRVGYDLHDFIVSPGHVRTIEKLNVYQPSAEWSLVKGRQFLTLTADGTGETPVLTARFRQPGGVVNREVVIKADAMIHSEGEGLKRGLRANWNFNNDFKNRSDLGDRIDGLPENNPRIEAGRGISGGAVVFDRNQKQFLNIPRSILFENSSSHTIAMRVKPSSLPAHGTDDRHFLYESTAAGSPDDKAAYNLSLGFRATAKPTKINLELHTHTLKPASKIGAAPTSVSQGEFECVLDRALFSHWCNIAVTFDSKALCMYLNGQNVCTHTLPIPGPSSEQGGLILGGHRNGVGRNFDGLMDEAAIWSRVLSNQEIKRFFGGVEPAKPE